MKYFYNEISKINDLDAAIKDTLKKKQYNEIRKMEREEFIVCIKKNKLLKDENEKVRRDYVDKKNEAQILKYLFKNMNIELQNERKMHKKPYKKCQNV